MNRLTAANKSPNHKSRGIYLRGRIWWICYAYQGQLIRQSIGPDRRLAEQALQAIRGDIIRGNFRLRRIEERRTFAEMVDEYMKVKSAKRSLARDATSFKNLLPVFGKKPLHLITTREIEGYARDRAAKVKGATVNRELALLRHFFNIAMDHGYTDQNPARAIKRYPESPWRHQFFFSESEVKALISASSPHLRPILALAFGTGLRKGDILGLRWEDVDLDRGIISIQMQKTGKSVEIPLIPMIRDLLQGMKSRASASPFVFPRGVSGQRIGDIKTAFHAALRRSGLASKGYRFHDIRRTFARMLYNQGVVLTKIQRLLGHGSVSTTERYLGVKFEETREAIMGLDEPLMLACSLTPFRTPDAKLPASPSGVFMLPEKSGFGGRPC
jgi:integrase